VAPSRRADVIRAIGIMGAFVGMPFQRRIITALVTAP
jgi:hypothetical protein